MFVWQIQLSLFFQIFELSFSSNFHIFELYFSNIFWPLFFKYFLTVNFSTSFIFGRQILQNILSMKTALLPATNEPRLHKIRIKMRSKIVWKESKDSFFKQHSCELMNIFLSIVIWSEIIINLFFLQFEFHIFLYGFNHIYKFNTFYTFYFSETDNLINKTFIQYLNFQWFKFDKPSRMCF